MRIVNPDGSLSIPKDVQEAICLYMEYWIYTVYSGTGETWEEFFPRTYREIFGKEIEPIT